MLFRKSMIYPLELQFTAKFFGTRIFRRFHFSDQYGIINASVYYKSKCLAHTFASGKLRAEKGIRSVLINSAQFKKMVKALAVCYISAFYLDYYNERESKRSIPAVKKELKSSKIGNVDRVIRNAVDDFFSELSYPILHYTFGGSELVCGEFQKNFSKEYVSLLGQSELSGTATLAQCVTQLVSQIYGMNFCPEKEELFDKTDEAIKSAVDEHIKELKEALRAAKRDDKSDAGEIALELKFFEAYRERYFS